MKFGKLPKPVDDRDLLFANYYRIEELRAAGTLPPLPAEFGDETRVPESDLGMLGNDEYGDCVEAAGCHSTQVLTAAGSGTPVLFTVANALAVYTAITGFNPNDPNSDQGTVIRDFLKYWQKTGLPDANGKIHKIFAYLSLDKNNQEEMKYGAYLFDGGEILGVQIPQSAMDQFNAGQPWDVTDPPDENILGGHGVPELAFRVNYIVASWAKYQQMTGPFWIKYGDEAWVVLSEEIFNGQGVTPEGLDLAQLQADLTAIQNVNPTPPVLSSLTLSGTVPTLTVGVPFDLATLSLTGADQSGNPVSLSGLTVTYQADEVTTGQGTVSGSILTPTAAGGLVVAASIGNVTSNTLGVTIVEADTSKQIIGTVGSFTLQAFGTPLTMDVAPVLLDVGGGGRVMVPVRFDAEARGDAVDWDEATKTFTITPKVTPGTEAATEAALVAVKAELADTKQKLAEKETELDGAHSQLAQTQAELTTANQEIAEVLAVFGVKKEG